MRQIKYQNKINIQPKGEQRTAIKIERSQTQSIVNEILYIVTDIQFLFCFLLRRQQCGSTPQ